MTYAAALAQDRDKYRQQRNTLAMHLEAVLASDASKMDRLKARQALHKIYDTEPSAEKILGLKTT